MSTKFSNIKSKLSSEQLESMKDLENTSVMLGTVTSRKAIGGCWEVEFDTLSGTKI